MSILDNIGDNLDGQHENNNFLPQKIELEDIDLGVKNFFEGLNITMMDQTGRQKRVPVIWLNQELFAQRKNYWEGLENENGEEIKRPFIAIARKGIKQGTAPNRRTIPWMKKFGFTRPRTFDGTLMGYDKYMVRQATWVDCDYEIRLVTSYMVDVNVFYQEILRDGFSSGQGYMNINGHQIRSILGEPSEDNQVSSISDERVFQVTAPLTVHGKIFDPSDHEKTTTINKVVLKTCETDLENTGVERTFGGQSAKRPFGDSLGPAFIYNFNDVLLSKVKGGEKYTISASTIFSPIGEVITLLGPGDSYTISDEYITNVLNSTGGTIASLAGGVVNVLDSQIINSTGGTIGFSIAEGIFSVPDVEVKDYSGTTLQSLTPGSAYTIPSSLVLDYSGATIAELGPGGSYFSPSGLTSTVFNSQNNILSIIEEGENFNVPDSTVSNSDSSFEFDLPATESYTIPDVTVINSDGQSASTIYNTTINTDFQAVKSGIHYQRPIVTTISESYLTYDAAWQSAQGTYDWSYPESPEVVAQVDRLATEADVRGVYYGSNGDGTDLIAPTLLTENNAFGNKYRFTDSIGNPSDASTSSLYDHCNFLNHSWTGAIEDYVIDHLTGLGYYIDVVYDGIKDSLRADETGQSYEEWMTFVHTELDVCGFTDWRLPCAEEFMSGMLWDEKYSMDYASVIMNQDRKYLLTNISPVSGSHFSGGDTGTRVRDTFNTNINTVSNQFTSNRTRVMVVRTHYA